MLDFNWRLWGILFLLSTPLAQGADASDVSEGTPLTSEQIKNGAILQKIKWISVPLRTAKRKSLGEAGGEMGQMCFTMAISPSNPKCMAVGIDTTAVYLSFDGGESWRLKRRGIKSTGVQSVAFDPRNANIIWAAGLRSTANTPRKILLQADVAKYSDPQVDGIYRSTDAGETWQLVRTASYFRGQAQNEYFAIDPSSFDGTQCRTIYAATHWQGLLMSRDAGKTWAPLGFAKDRIHAVILNPQDPLQVFVASDAGLFWRKNKDGTFKKIGGGLPAVPVEGIVINCKNPLVLYVALGRQGVWRSQDGGKTFAPSGRGLKKHDWRRLAISPANPDNLYVVANAVGDNSHLCWSHDGGNTWHSLEKIEEGFIGLSAYYAEGIVAHPVDPNVAFHPRPMRKTTDGGRTWTYSSNGLSGCRRTTRTSIAFLPNDPQTMVFFHTDHGGALTTDGGDTFEHISPPRFKGSCSTPVGAADPTPGSHKLISAVGHWNEQVICVSSDNGQHWTLLEKTVGNYRFMAFNPQDPRIVYAGRVHDSLRSRDGGATWQRIPYSIRALLASNGKVVFAVRKFSPDSEARVVLRSFDAGDTWQVLPGKIPVKVYEIDVDPKTPDRLYAASDDGIWVFDGKGWGARSTGQGLERDNFGGLCFGKIAVDPTRPNIIYAGQRYHGRGAVKGVFRSLDYGESWQNVSGNLGPDLNIWAITISPHDGTVWLGTDSGNWRLAVGAKK